MNKQQMMEHVIELQDAFNKQVAENWKDCDFEWWRAIVAECVELEEMLGFKWWEKPPVLDEFQAKLEVVDIFAFGVSSAIASKALEASDIPKAIDRARRDYVAIDQIDSFMQNILIYKKFNISSLLDFAKICKCFGIGFKDLYRLYIAKTALNHHRQINGYKNGDYEKIWQGRQDNEHLEELFIQLSDVADENLLSEMTIRLQQRYNAMVGK